MTPRPRPPLALRPLLQFGHAQPGGTALYHQVLFNHFLTDTLVTLDGASWRNWNVDVYPTSLTVHPGITNPITITVGVPLSPTNLIDVERTRATGGVMHPVTATAYLITLAGRRPFTDLAADYWADDPIQYLASGGIVSGYADGSFRPNNNVTRAQFAKMLVGAMGWPIETPSSPSFYDVSQSYWAYGYIETAAVHGVISGYSDGNFRPDQSITRAQVAKMIVTARGWSMELPATGSFTDIGLDNWAYGFAEMVNASGVMSGYGDGTFRPAAHATRAQIAKILTYALFCDPTNNQE